ncbi:hypothetical protein BaRGS_00031762 [Batillaria attramentaria]|uniref:Uncharacterized protein n=1 Tax=Batillaria attramentaria TaxID=370345 RepID=A0ABD0JQH8_9CAEN
MSNEVASHPNTEQARIKVQSALGAACGATPTSRPGLVKVTESSLKDVTLCRKTERCSYPAAGTQLHHD